MRLLMSGMNRYGQRWGWLSLIGVLAAALGWASLAAGAVLDPATVKATVLPNQMRVIVKEDHSIGIVAINIVVRVASRNESEDNNGVAHFVEHMLFKGTTNREMGGMDREIEAVGGTLNAGTMKDFTHYYTVVPSSFFEAALDLLADAIVNPTFPAQEIEKERRVILEEVRRLRDNPQATLWDLVSDNAYQVHPYRRPISGSVSQVLSITRKQLMAFHRDWYVPNNISVVMVGDVDAEQAVSAVRKAFATFPVGNLPQSEVPEEPAQQGVRLVEEGRPVKQAYLAMAFHVPGISTPAHVWATDLLVTLLGEGFSSRLSREIKERQGLVDHIGAEFLTQRDPGLFTIWATCQPEKVLQAKTAILAEVKKVRDTPIPEEELAKAKRLLEVSYIFANETYADQADTLGFYEGIATYQLATEYLDAIRKVSGADVAQAAKRYLNPDQYTWVSIRPRK